MNGKVGVRTSPLQHRLYGIQRATNRLRWAQMVTHWKTTSLAWYTVPGQPCVRTGFPSLKSAADGDGDLTCRPDNALKFQFARMRGRTGRGLYVRATVCPSVRVPPLELVR